MKRAIALLLTGSGILFTGLASAEITGPIALRLPDLGISSEIESFKFSVENSGNIGSGSGGAGAGKATFDTVTVERLTDQFSPDILAALISGTSTTAMIQRSGLSVTLRPALVTSYTLNGSSDEAQLESITLTFGSAMFDVDGGAKRTRKEPEWSRVKNQPQ
jgi:type VI secretion system secreted protein Hcp